MLSLLQSAYQDEVVYLFLVPAEHPVCSEQVNVDALSSVEQFLLVTPSVTPSAAESSCSYPHTGLPAAADAAEEVNL